MPSSYVGGTRKTGRRCCGSLFLVTRILKASDDAQAFERAAINAARPVGIASKLEALVEPTTRGDPRPPLRWTT